MNNTDFLARFWEMSGEAQKILIVSHVGPDDDAVSSSLSIYHLLTQAYPDKQIQIGFEGEMSERYRRLPSGDKVKCFDNLKSELNNFDCLIAVDGSELHRFTKADITPPDLPVASICIDHHHGKTDDIWSLFYKDTEASSNAELLFRLFYHSPDPVLAQLLLVGIWGDTGHLLFIKHHQAYVYGIVEQLVTDAGVDVQAFKSSYSYVDQSVLEVTKLLLANQQIVTVAGWPPVSVSHLNRDILANLSLAQIKEGIDLYLGSFAMVVEQVNWSLTFYPTTTGVNVSARSRPGSVNVRRLLEELQVGGGHDQAAGGKWLEELAQPVDKWKQMHNWLIQHQPHLTPNHPFIASVEKTVDPQP